MAEKEKHYTTHEVSRICGVAPITVGRWVKAGRLEAFRTVGGHRRIPASSLDAFLRKYNIPRLEPSAPSRRVLIVDDDPDMVDATRGVLSTLDDTLTIRGAADGFEAGSLVVAFRPQLVFLDLMMPGIDGFTVCRRIKENEATEGVEVVGYTGYYTEENREKLLEAGALDVLKKPAPLEVLRELLARVFEPAE